MMATCSSRTRTDTESVPPVVFIHGLFGSHLETADGRRRFLTAAQVLRKGNEIDRMPLPLERSNSSRQLKDKLRAAGPLEDLRICYVRLKTLYGPFLDEMRASRRFEVFAYDWRRDLGETQEALEKFLDGYETVPQVVCHSMGGLITLPLLHKRPELFHSVLFAAAAFGGSIGYVREVSEFSKRNSFGMNDAIANPQLWPTWTSAYHFFPLADDKASVGFDVNRDKTGVFEADNTPIAVDFHDSECWRKLELGPYHPKSNVTMGQSEEAFFAETLVRCQAYRQSLVARTEASYPPVAVLQSDCESTAVGFCRPHPTAPFDLDSPISIPGDGQVPLGYGVPRGVPVIEVVTNHESHSGVLNDLVNVRKILADLIAAANMKNRWSEPRR